jgi:hypothetical protein
MGFHLYADWPGETTPAHLEPGNINLHAAWFYWQRATMFLLSEAFETDYGAAIPAAVLKERLPHTLDLIQKQERLHGSRDEGEIEELCQAFRDFVLLCERKEMETGEPVSIVVDCYPFIRQTTLSSQERLSETKCRGGCSFNAQRTLVSS